MHPIDWILLSVPVMAVLVIGFYTQSYMKSVADFMAGGRLAGRYLLAVARGEMQSGAVVFVATFEVISHAGFTLEWWGWLQSPVYLFFAIVGFVIYRFRETRAFTLAQFFEIRYSRAFRLFTGMLAFCAGLVNFGIIPAIGARFFVYFLQLPPEVHLLSVTVPTFVLLMSVFLSVTLTITLMGGLLTVMIADCVEGMLSQWLYLVIIVGLLMIFGWPDISHVLASRPVGQSLLNPMDSQGIKDFNIWYLLMGMFVNIYGIMAWQNASAYNAAAISPHESRIGGILGKWREFGKFAVVILLAVCSMTFLEHPNFATQSAMAHSVIDHISVAHTREQMRVPIALSYLLPVGVKGALCAVLLMGIFGGDATHLHSWGGIFVQDVLMPLRKKPFTPKQHILVLRLSIAGVALFAFVFGALFKQTEYIYMWFSVTQTIFVGGAGAAIIGGLYWKKGTTAGAWSALLTGSVLCTGGILIRQFYDKFPLNGMEISFYATLIAIGVYIVVSLLTHTEDFNLERMLHRGVYAAGLKINGDSNEATSHVHKKPSILQMIIGIDENFSIGDKWITYSLFA
jgi:SSS family solute:Na+ symporter